MNDILNTMYAHRSIRSYQDKPVEEAYLDQIIQAVQAAPNWVNLQHVSIIAVKDAQRRKKFSELCGNQPHIAQAPIFLVFCADYYRTYLACKMNNQSLDEIMSDIDSLIVAAHETGIATASAVVAAEALGLGTVVIGDVRLNAQELIKELNLPEYVVPMLGLCIGYAAEEPGLKPRLPKEAVYFEETYYQNLDELLDEYNKTYSHYLETRPWNKRVGNWTDMVADFYSTAFHYPKMAEALEQQKFPVGNKRN